MLTKKRYTVKEMFLWSRHDTILFAVFSTIVVVLYHIFEFKFLDVPWTPVALIGTAVAFIVGFQNNSAYGRIWEARKIWGGMVNTSRTFTMKVRDMVSNEYASEPVSEEELKENIQTIVYRHIAWLTALRHAMRQRKPWETFEDSKTNREWSKMIHIPEKMFSLDEDLFHYLSADEWEYVMNKGNKATAILFLQSKHLKKLKEKGLIWEFSFLELENLLEEMFNLQGKSERIKNFPYPRQYASLAYYYVRVFLLLLPFGIIPSFSKVGESLISSYPMIGHNFIWLGIPFCTAVSWVFHTMERMARTGENPFEGTANDVPISTIARGIEIDLRQMLDEDHDMIPKQFPEEHHVQM
ncbi:UPF0187 protein [Flavobacteriaceae bacterium UJ101]|nr:UPF0187 protein [Flavobacteriaceae bacterium UJ101]